MTHYLNYPLARPLQPVAHDVAPLCKSIENFVKAYKEEGMWGSVEIGGVVAWQVIRKELPDLKTIVVRRPIQEVYSSITEEGYQGHLANLAELDEMLNVVSAQSDVLSIETRMLDSPAVCKWLFEYCLELEFDFDWWAQISALDIQVKLEDVMKNKDEIEVRYNAFRQDVLERMKEIHSILH
jgi:hypothetical protein